MKAFELSKAFFLTQNNLCMYYRYIALLRGINVSGQKLIKMADLKVILSKLGYQNITTYIQSGNIIFDALELNTKTIEREIHLAIKNNFEFDVFVLVKTSDEIASVVSNNPFMKMANIDIERCYFTLLDAKPNEDLQKKLMETDFGNDQLIVAGTTAYLYIPVSYGNTKLSNNFIEQKLKVNATSRNLKTMQKLVELSAKA